MTRNRRPSRGYADDLESSDVSYEDTLSRDARGARDADGAEKRRLQAEMRKREAELLEKIKQQQRELEDMRNNKIKVRCSEMVSLPPRIG